MGMISVYAVGWIDEREYGCVRGGIRESYDARDFPREKIFPFPYKNFGRLDRVSKLTCAAVALALKDAEVECAEGLKYDIGIISSGIPGCLETDMLYFRDYIENGRTLARGNLFIYTLPSSPAGEAAIYFGLQGPLLYVTGGEKPVVASMRTAFDMLRCSGASAMLAGTNEADASLYFLLGDTGSSSGDGLCLLEHALNIVEKGLSIKKMIQEFSNIKKGKAVI